MTFTELDDIVAETGRRALASRMIVVLLDALDQGDEGIELDRFENDSGYVRTNIRTVAQLLRNKGVIDVFYYREAAGKEMRAYTSESTAGRWAKQHYRLTSAVRKLYRRD